MLGRDEHRVERHGLVVLVDDAHLGLAVRPQVRELAGAPHLGEALSEPVREPDRKRHQVRRLVAGVPEHHPLVAGALSVQLVLAPAPGPHLGREVHALGDVGRLLVERDDHPAGDPREALVVVVVPDVADRLSDEPRHVDVGRGSDLARDDDEPGREERLASDPALRVLLEQSVEDGVRDLVGDLVRVALCDRLGCECVAAAHSCPPGIGRLGKRDRSGPLCPGADPGSQYRARRGRPSTWRRPRRFARRLRRRGSSPSSCRGRSRRRAAVTSFADHDVHTLRRQLPRGALDGVTGLCGETHEDLALAPAPAELGEDVRGRLEDQVGDTVLLVQLLGRGDLWTEVRHGGGHDDHVRDSADRASTACSISAAVSTLTTSCDPGRQERGRRHEAHLRTRATAASASAWPCLPDDLFVMNRTGSIGSRVPPAVTSTRSPSRSRAPR